MTRNAVIIDTRTAVETLNQLLRSELAAVATYETALRGIDDDASLEADHLLQFAAEHQASARRLREEVQKLGGDPVSTGGIWAAFAKAKQISANVFGDLAAVRYLKDCEEAGLGDYESARETVDTPTREVLDEELLPRQRRHIAFLSSLALRLRSE